MSKLYLILNNNDNSYCWINNNLLDFITSQQFLSRTALKVWIKFGLKKVDNWWKQHFYSQNIQAVHSFSNSFRHGTHPPCLKHHNCHLSSLFSSLQRMSAIGQSLENLSLLLVLFLWRLAKSFFSVKEIPQIHLFQTWYFQNVLEYLYW